MKIELDASLTVHQNATKYYDAAKEKKRKAESIVVAMAQMQHRLEREKKKFEYSKLQAAKSEEELPSKKIREADLRKKEWFERFLWFRTSGGFLVVAGKDASQNEVVAGKYAKDGDLFFHADIQGASATVLFSEGKKVPESDKREAAAFAASNSSAWKRGFGSVDVYSVDASQLSKKSHGEFVSKGGFVMHGSREWYRNTELGLKIGVDEKGRAVSVPITQTPAFKVVSVKPGVISQNDASKQIAKKLGMKETSAILSLIGGPCEIYL